MAGFEVTTADLESARAFVQDVADEITSELNSVTADMYGLFSSSWQGSAADGFALGWQEWASGAHQIVAALGQVGSLLAGTAHQYEGHEAAAVTAINGSGSGLS